MSESVRIACFFTAGCTELSAMIGFMEKINANALYVQLCPREQKRKRGTNANGQEIRFPRESGLTGEALIGHILKFIATPTFKSEQYDAILIEDDKDSRFLRKEEDGTSSIDIDAWHRYKEDVLQKIHAKCPGIPIIFFLAAPEVEAWFVADWQNTFGSIYKEDIGAAAGNYFSNRFRQYVNQHILTDRYKDCIESYGFFSGDTNYKKLSEELQTAIRSDEFWSGDELGVNRTKIDYSKSWHGARMLRQLDPETVQRSCTVFFRDAYWELKNLTV